MWDDWGGLVRRDADRQAWLEPAWLGGTRPGPERRDKAGKARRSTARSQADWRGERRREFGRRGRHGMARVGTVWPGEVWEEEAWREGLVRDGAGQALPAQLNR